MAARVLYLLDISSYIYRAFHAIRGLASSQGFPTNAVYGVTNMLLKVIRDRQPQYLALVFDSKAPTFRHKKYPEYKAHRPPMPEELVMQLPYIQKVIAAFRFPSVVMDGFEADDLIATLSREAKEAGFAVEIISGDRDLLPLVGEGVSLWDPMKDVRYDPAAIREKYGVEPKQLVEVKALAGDPSDNIPGVPGIGEKTALKLISQFHTLDNLLAHLSEVKEKGVRAKLEEHAALARLSRELVQLEDQAPLPVEVEKLHPGAPDRECLRRLFMELEFSKLTKELGFETPMAQGFVCVAAAGEIPSLTQAVKAAGQAAIFFIFGEGHPVMAPVAGVGLAWGEGEGAYIPFNQEMMKESPPAEPPESEISPNRQDPTGKVFGGNCKGKTKIGSDGPNAVPPLLELSRENILNEVAVLNQAGVKAVWEELGPIWTDPEVAKVGADLKAARLAGERFGCEMDGTGGDILLASYLLNPARYEQTLENVALHYLGVNLPGPRELAGRPLAATDLPPDLACQYAGGRAEAALKLWPLLQGELEREGLWPLYADLELPLLTVLARLEARGILVDREFLERFGRDLESQIQALEDDIYREAGETFLINSPQQLGRILFDKLGLKPQKKTKGKTAFSTDMEVLQSLAEQAPMASKVLEYRSLGKLKATYVDALLKLINPATGRVHTTFLQSVAATGRLSSRDPNLQNIPVRGEMGGQIRQAFVAPPGHVLLSADYSQMELRLMAHFSGDPLLLQAFTEGVDIHRQTAAVVFGIHPELVTADMRRQAKVINFGIIYGMSAFGLAKQLGIGNRLSQEFIQRYFDRHPQIKAFLDETLETARRQGWVTTLLGRRRQIPQINSQNRLVRQEAERSAINTPLQGSAADLIKKAMLTVEDDLARAGLAARMLLQIHDELLLEVPREELPVAARMVKHAMEGVEALKVPLVVDLRAGANWGELYPVDNSFKIG